MTHFLNDHMNTAVFLFGLMITACTTTVCCAGQPVLLSSDAIVAMTGLTVEPSVFENQNLEQPLLVCSKEDAAQYFNAKSVETLANKVDFESHVVILFAWQGSGQDRLDYTVQESYPETIQFTFTPGRTRDLRQHFQVYAIRSNVNLRVSGKEISLIPATDDSDFVRVEIRGRLDAQIMAIGGETTGIVIRAGNIEWELEARNPTTRQLCEQLHEQTVIVRGTLHRRWGVEITERWIVDVTDIEAVKRK